MDVAWLVYPNDLYISQRSDIISFNQRVKEKIQDIYVLAYLLKNNCSAAIICTTPIHTNIMHHKMSLDVQFNGW